MVQRNGIRIDEEEESSLGERERKLAFLKADQTEDPGQAPAQFEEEGQATLDELLQVNLALKMSLSQHS